jgi:hypothetical protein
MVAGLFAAATFVICVIYGLVMLTAHMTQFLEITLPGFRWLSIEARSGLVEMFLFELRGPGLHRNPQFRSETVRLTPKAHRSRSGRRRILREADDRNASKGRPAGGQAVRVPSGEALPRGTGGSSPVLPGLPYEAVRGAKAKGGFVVGISPGLSIEEHRGKYRSPVEGFDVLVYTGSGLMGREITNIRSCDIVVIAGGRTGTLGELAIAYDEGG